MGEKDFDAYLMSGFKYGGLMNGLANSIELLLNSILEKIHIKPPGMLGNKIGNFDKNKINFADKCTEDFDELVRKLREFNRYWIITKHGMIVGGKKDLTFHKNGKFHTFDQIKQNEISQLFTEIMRALTEIYNKI